MSGPAPGELLYEPTEQQRAASQLGHFAAWLATNRGISVESYEQLHRWSIEHLEDFWAAIWDYFDLQADGEREIVLAERVMPGARWFPGTRLNYAEHLLRHATTNPDATAIYGYSQTRAAVRLTWAELSSQVAAAQRALATLGVGPGVRVAGYLPNSPETAVAYIATISLGGIWASCAPEFGPQGVIDRFAQIEPTVLLAVSGYTYGAKAIDKRDDVAAVRRELPTVEHLVQLPFSPVPLDEALSWSELLEQHAGSSAPGFTRVPFDHPMVVLFSSGTTGKPKAIMHGHGGLLVEHLKSNTLSWDLGPDDTFLWFSTTTWMMWNSLVSALLTGASIVMIDGNPAFPSLQWQLELAAETGTTVLGLSPAFVAECRRQGVQLDRDRLRVREVCAAGSPMSQDAYRWIYQQLGDDVLLNVGCGGTDVCTGIVQGSPWHSVWAGEISGRCLGVAAEAYDEDGDPIVGELGELVITEPMPSMPVGFWGDQDGSHLRSSYFDHNAEKWGPGIWRHGDWIRFADTGSCVVTGRSDATLNRGGVRLGTADFYAALDRMPDVVDGLVVHLEDDDGGMGTLWLFVVLDPGVELTDELRRGIAAGLRTALSPRHVPDRIVAVAALPFNRTGKKLELPVKKILQGAAPTDVASTDALVDPDALLQFERIRREFA